MVKRIIFILAACAFLVSSAYAVDTLTSFQPTIQKLEISRNGGKTYITVFENNTTPIDLVAINGQNVGTFIGDASVPAGNYNYARVIVTGTSFTFTVNNGANGNGTLNIAASDIPAGTFPIVQTNTMSVVVTANGTVNGVINFDAATSYSGLTYIFNGGAAPNQYTFTGVNMNPNISITSE